MSTASRLWITLLLTVIVVVATIAPEKVTEAKGQSDRVNVEMVETGTYQYRLHGQLKFDRNNNVEVQWFDCTVDWSLPLTSVETTWCGEYSNGEGWKEIGANYTVYLARNPWVSPLSRSRYMRIRVYPDGTVKCYPGGCSYSYE